MFCFISSQEKCQAENQSGRYSKKHCLGLRVLSGSSTLIPYALRGLKGNIHPFLLFCVSLFCVFAVIDFVFLQVLSSLRLDYMEGTPCQIWHRVTPVQYWSRGGHLATGGRNVVDATERTMVRISYGYRSWRFHNDRNGRE